nr:copper chaperone PCu(A)C [Marinicella sp. W31]MDC2879608.1 copper chaperone PCu(A)C [Marinicella sp. W31]
MTPFMNRLARVGVLSLVSLTFANAHIPLAAAQTATAETGKSAEHNGGHDAKPASDVMVGDLEISGTFARATLPGAPVGGGFLTITNRGDTDDRLVSASSEVAGVVQLHNMRMDGDVMKMYQMPDGIPLPAHETVTLKPGGLHVMFMKLNGPLVEDSVIDVELTFEEAGKVTVAFPVKSIAAKEADPSSNGMDHGGMKAD